MNTRPHLIFPWLALGLALGGGAAVLPMRRPR